MAARQTVIIGGITLAAVLAGVLWYQLSTTPDSKKTAKTSPTPRPSVAAAFVTTPTPTPKPEATPAVVAVQTSAKTGVAENAIAGALASIVLGGSGLAYSIKRVRAQIG